MELERISGYEDVYAYIESQFLDQPQEPKPTRGPKIPPRAKLVAGSAAASTPGTVYSALGGPPPPVPASEIQTQSPETQPVEQTSDTAKEHALSEMPVSELAVQAVMQQTPAVRMKRIKNGEAVQLRIPNLEDYLPNLLDPEPDRLEVVPDRAVVSMHAGTTPQKDTRKSGPKPAKKLKRPELSGPRPRKRTKAEQIETLPPVPEELMSLVRIGDEGVLEKYYQRSRGESKEEILSRITNPELSLEEAARLLGVCPATIRRYTNKGWLRHHRTKGNQRRFHLSDIAEFVREFRDKLTH